MFVAKKPCTFAGKSFLIGETIPTGLVLPEAVTRLIKSGVIAEADNAGPLLPAVASLEEAEEIEEEAEESEEEIEEEAEESEEEPCAEILNSLPNTEDGLMRVNRDKLAEAATLLGMEVTEEHTKRVLAAFILELKAGSEE